MGMPMGLRIPKGQLAEIMGKPSVLPRENLNVGGELIVTAIDNFAKSQRGPLSCVVTPHDDLPRRPQPVLI